MRQNDDKMIPYALLFNAVRYSDIKVFRGIWQEWLCIRAASAEPLENWEICLADDPLKYDFYFDERIKLEEAYFFGKSPDGRCYLLAVGFAWKMFSEKVLTAEEIYDVIDTFDEDICGYFYDYIHGDKSALLIVEKELCKYRKNFENKIWNIIPNETRELFYNVKGEKL